MMGPSSVLKRPGEQRPEGMHIVEEEKAREPRGYSDDDVESDISVSEALYSKEGTDDSTKREGVSIARAETKVVRSLKLIMLGILLVSSIGVATAVYFYTHNSEQQQFQSDFNDNSRKVLEAMGRSLDRTLGTLDAYTASLVSSAKRSNQTFPFVTIDDFAYRTEKTRLLTDSVTISIQPLVKPEQRSEWEKYAADNNGWVNETMALLSTDEFYYGDVTFNVSTHDVIHEDFQDVPSNSTRPMLPTWQNSPFSPRWPAYNWDLLSQEDTQPVYRALETSQVVLGAAYNFPDPNDPAQAAEIASWIDWFQDYVADGEDPGEPASDIYVPIVKNGMDNVQIDTNASDAEVAGLVMIIIFWRDLMKEILPTGTNGVVVVFRNECNPTFTYRIDGPLTTYLGKGDHHESKYDAMAVSTFLSEIDDFYVRPSKYTGLPLDHIHCPFHVAVYPSSAMEADYTSTNPVYYTLGAALIFAFTAAVFLMFDCFVERRQRKVMTTVVRSNKIIASLFPSVVRDRLYVTEETMDGSVQKKVFKLASPTTKLKSFLNEGTTSGETDETERGDAPGIQGEPIAELYPDCTVMFCDIKNFTAWSSARSPQHVFKLLETIYSAFDAIAKRRGVFKVETIGDSYVAVCGLPESRQDHAVVMARFARDCRDSMNELTRRLESSLGPDTGDLKLRLGLNSGPVTAGVLRGVRARFQLFGDTVNTASRMESTGMADLIQVSQKTADLLQEAGKGNWLTAREDLVDAKGKGMLQTYFLEPPSAKALNRYESGGGSSSDAMSVADDVLHVMGLVKSAGNTSAARLERLIDWNVDTMKYLVKNIVARRQFLSRAKSPVADSACPDALARGLQPRSEVTEVITLPEFDFKVPSRIDNADVDLSEEVLWQIRDLVSVIGYMYRRNPFHNFEHASHVVMSTMKLLGRVVSPEVYLSSVSRNRKKVVEAVASNLHQSTYGMASDPLTQFAVAFAALVHDVDHGGVSNQQLVAESDPLALKFDNLSPAEQHSACVAWELILRPAYKDLRACLFSDADDLNRFRQLLVNSVMATDIFDPDLKRMRESRWEKAFQVDPDAPGSEGPSSVEGFNRKATIVIEHLIQASDVSHTMQHWTLYIKWNKRLFEEMYLAYKAGRSPKNPADGWYRGELWFFDNYVIPLAKKLRECGVFGVSCDEFLDYANDNRTEWEAKGEELVQEMKCEAEAKVRTRCRDISIDPDDLSHLLDEGGGGGCGGGGLGDDLLSEASTIDYSFDTRHQNRFIHNHVHMGPSSPIAALLSARDGQDAVTAGVAAASSSSSSQWRRMPTGTTTRTPTLCGMALMSTHPRDYGTVLQLSRHLPEQVGPDGSVTVVPCLGVHPWFLHELTDADWEPVVRGGEGEEPADSTTATATPTVPAWLAELENLLVQNEGAIVGEIGLDGFHFDPITKGLTSPVDRQVEAFAAQVELAARLRRPASVHCVQAFGSMMRVLSEAKRRRRLPPKLYFHAFGGKVGTAKQLLSICSTNCDAYFGFAPIVNFRSPKTAELVRFVGLDRLLLESDHEDAALVAGSVEEAIAFYATALDVSEQDVVERTTRNAARFYGLRIDSGPTG